MVMAKDEFRFLWDEVRKLQDQVKDLQEAVNTLLNTTHKLDMEHRLIGPGDDDYGRQTWKVPTGLKGSVFESRCYCKQIPPDVSEEELEDMKKRLDKY
jgi:hypothetical protein